MYIYMYIYMYMYIYVKVHMNLYWVETHCIYFILAFITVDVMSYKILST